MKIPSTWEEWVALGSRLGLNLFRLQVIGMLIGAVVTISLQLLTGFWQFREEHQDIIRKQYEEVLAANTRFEAQVSKFNQIFAEKHQQGFGEQYSDEAQAYIRVLEGATRLLPGTSEELVTYIESMSQLNKYYSSKDVPPSGSLDWARFYGNFRVDYNRYLKAREQYLVLLAEELGDYGRYLINS
ncbi:hypothetical protein [Sinorhizobium medicae]|uniref:hypothetical protein n=1 Tax=Sinorhizobium medicae TaxID=110321 RepID=UPI000489A056|nr:hypothetical protein [Sinorhizobium medicae]MDX0695430.1 hypothetical protein [Sinorhizobium medicae]MDX0744952.1 hypothetical protein [Sinorhizobium medicae]